MRSLRRVYVFLILILDMALVLLRLYKNTGAIFLPVCTTFLQALNGAMGWRLSKFQAVIDSTASYKSCFSKCDLGYRSHGFPLYKVFGDGKVLGENSVPRK